MKMVKIPAPKELMDIEKSGKELPTSIQKDLVTLIAFGYVAHMGTMRPKKSIIKMKIKEWKEIYPQSWKKTKVLLFIHTNFEIHTN